MPAFVEALRACRVEAGLSVGAERSARRATAMPPDLVHDHGLWLPSNHAVALGARRRRLPLVISPRGMLEPWALNHRRWRKRLAWLLYQRRDLETAAAIHATSEAEAESVRRLGLVGPIAIIPNGVDIPASLPPRTSSGQRRVLFLSRIHPKKGLPGLISAWAQVRPAGWELVIAGPDEGGHRAEVQSQARRLGLNGTIRFVGPVDDDQKWMLYRSADLFVLPTHSENFGLVVAEALAAGVPVITTKGAPWSVLETHRCGWWVDVGVEPLAASLREAVALTDDQRRALGRAGRRYVEEHLSWDLVARQMRAVYEWVLYGGKPPDCVRLS